MDSTKKAPATTRTEVETGRSRWRRSLVAAMCVAVAALVFPVAPASAFRYFQSEITEVPGSAPVPGAIGHAYKVATDGSNDLWVLDANGPYGGAYASSGKGVVDKFDPSGGFLAQSTGEGGWFPNGGELRGLDFDNASGLLYVSDNSNARLWKLNSGGFVQGSIVGSPSNWGPLVYQCCSIQVDVDNTNGPNAGDIYVSASSCCENEEQGVYRIDANGQPVDFATSETNVEGNHLKGTTHKVEDGISPVGVAIAANGDIWVATRSALDKFDASGKFIGSFDDFPVSKEAGVNLQDIAIDPTNGHILVASQTSEGDGVWEFKPDGTYIESLTSPSGFVEPTGVAVDSAGTVYVADGAAVKVFGKDFPLPGISYEPVTNQTQTAGTLHATIDPGEGGPVTSCEIEYGTDSSYGSTAPCSPDPNAAPPGSNFTAPTQVSAALSGLTPEQEYHYRFVAGNANVTRRGADQVFIPHWVVGLETTAATELTPTTATINGAFQGNGKPTAYHFKWGKTEEYGSTTPESDAGSPNGPTQAHADLAGLAPVTTYHYRIAATSPDGTSEGSDETFTTPPLPPTVGEWVTDVHSDSVAFHAKVNPGGGATTYQVQYVDDAKFQESEFAEASTAPGTEEKVGSGFGDVEVSTTVAPLTPGTTYHYRVEATNAYRTTVGEARTFTTFVFGGSEHDPCPNAQIRQQTGAALLFECRAYELVSAGDTAGYDVESDIVPNETPFGGYPQASDPSRVLYGIHQGAVPGNWDPTNLGLDPYVATRGQDGWTTQYVGLSAHEVPSAHPFASAFGGASANLGTVAFSGTDLCAPCFEDGSTGIPVRLPDGSIVQGMAGSLDPGPSAEANILVRKRLSDDGSHLVFGSTAMFEPDANPSGPSIYDRDLNAGTTHVVSKLPDGQNIPCLIDCSSDGIAELDMSADGSHILIGQLVSIDSEGNHYWHLYMDVGDSPQGIDLMPGSTSGALYDGMTSDGTRVFFTSRDKLASDTDDSADIYRADVSDSAAVLTRVSTGTEGTGDTDACDPGLDNARERWNSVGSAANCNAVAIGGGGGVASSSSTIYFLSPELLDGSSNGTENAPNLYLDRVGSSPKYVTTLESSEVVPQPPPRGHPFLRSFGSLARPTGIAYEPKGDFVYVLEPGEGEGKVAKFDSKGHPVSFTAGSEQGGNVLTGADTPEGRFFEVQQIGLPNELAVDQTTGDFYVPNVLGAGFYGAIDKFAPSGEFLAEIPMEGFFTAPSAVTIDQGDDDLYVATYGTSQVEVFSSSGTLKSSFTTIESPTSVAVDSSGRVYVSDGARAALYDSSGNLIRELDVGVAKGVAVDSADDHVYVDEGTQIKEFDASGNLVPGNATGSESLKSSTGLAVDSGEVLATDTELGTVSVWGPSRVLPNPLYDNPAVLDAVGEAEARHTADFQVTPSGEFAAFSSKLPLTGYDNDGHAEIFRFDASNEEIACASCAATGARATGDASLATNGLSLSDDGRVFFNSTDPLIPSDLNGHEDAFEWLNGKIGPISSGSSPIDSSLLSISADGTDAYFFTRESLAPQDENGNSVKIYDARVNGGFPYQPPIPPCKASDECHGPGTQAAPPPDIGTYKGTGGNTETAPPTHHAKRRHRHKHRHHRVKRGHGHD